MQAETGIGPFQVFFLTDCEQRTEWNIKTGIQGEKRFPH